MSSRAVKTVVPSSPVLAFQIRTDRQSGTKAG
jgi:hypothetical protein